MESKVIKIYNFEIIAENEFTKVFKCGDIEIYLSKAFDEDADKHYLVASIPNIEEVNVSDIKYPFEYDTSEERDVAFKFFDKKWARVFIKELIEFIKKPKDDLFTKKEK